MQNKEREHEEAVHTMREQVMNKHTHIHTYIHTQKVGKVQVRKSCRLQFSTCYIKVLCFFMFILSGRNTDFILVTLWHTVSHFLFSHLSFPPSLLLTPVWFCWVVSVNLSLLSLCCFFSSLHWSVPWLAGTTGSQSECSQSGAGGYHPAGERCSKDQPSSSRTGNTAAERPIEGAVYTGDSITERSISVMKLHCNREVSLINICDVM